MENNNKETTNAKTKSGARKYAPYITGAGIVAVLLFLFVASPMLANAGKVGLANSTPSTSLFTSAASAPQANLAQAPTVIDSANLQTFKISVQIPCSGHTPLILSEVGKMTGVVSIKNSGGWNSFEITYDSSKTTKEQILGSELFKSYPATIL